MHQLTRWLLALLVAAPMLGPSPFAWASYPERPVRIVVGFGAGSAADVAARIVGEELRDGRRIAPAFVGGASAPDGTFET
jgi:tripartite-type tricarboxylate transporter receptor subunit TctC